MRLGLGQRGMELPAQGIRRLRAVVLQGLDRSAVGLGPRPADLAADRIAILQPEPSQDRAQAQALEHQRTDHHAEGGEHDQVAIGKRAALRPALGQGQGRGDGDEAAHPRPRDGKAGAETEIAGRAKVIRLIGGDAEADTADGARRQNPRDANEDHGDDHGAADGGIREFLLGRHPRQDRPDLLADQHEGEDVEHEDRRFPDRVRDHPRARRGLAGGVAGDGDREADHGEHPGQLHRLGGDPEAEGSRELQHDDAGRLIDAAQDPQVDERGERPRHEAADDTDQEGRRHLGKGEMAGHRRRHAEPVDQQRGGVVQKALAAQDRGEAVRQGDVVEHRQRRHGVRRSDDRPEHDGGSERHVRHEPQSDRRDRRGRRRHRADGEPGDGAGIAHEITQRRAVAGIHQHRCEEQGERQLRVEREARHAGHEGEPDATQGEEGWIGRAQAPR